MRSVSGGFLTMLAANSQLVEADLYTITYADGTVAYYNSSQSLIVSGGHNFLPSYLDSAPSFVRGKISCKVGFESDSLELDILYDSGTLMKGLLPSALASAGGLDNALIRVDKALAPDWSNPVVNGLVNLFVGYVAELRIETGKIALTVNNRLKLLNTSFPRNYFLPQCNHALFDAGCGLNPATYAVAGTVAGSPTQTQFNSNRTEADTYFALGYVLWLTGANAGLTSSVKSYLNASGSFTIIYPLPVAPTAGDTFTAYPGCDKLEATCNTKFANLSHFRGFPFVPTPETLELGSAGSPPNGGTSSGAGVGGVATGTGGQPGNFKQQ